MEQGCLHKPVMIKEALGYLQLKNKDKIVDATIGVGGHAEQILRNIFPDGRLIGIDRDKESLEIAKERLKDFSSNCVLVHDNFFNIDKIFNSLHISKVDGVLLDLGISSFQIDNSERGFSFVKEGPLDMRMDRDSYISAFDLVNNLTQEEISSILWRFGQERFSNRIARALVNYRKGAMINSTTELSDIISRSIPYHKAHYRIHPATRTFQALRIAVNRELEFLDIFLNKISSFMKIGSRLCIISFHSLEDRIVKVKFRELSKREGFGLVFKKPLIPTDEEIQENHRSRSAKLRVLEKIS